MADLGASYGSIPITQQVDVPNALAAGYQLVRQRQGIDTQNALASAVPMLQTDPQNAFATAAAKSPQAALQLVPIIKQMDDEKKAQATERADALGNLAYSLKTQYPDPTVRRAVALSQAPNLAQHGVTPDMLANFDYSDQNLQVTINNMQQVKDLIAQSQKDTELNQSAAKTDEQIRHDKADEANSSMTARASLLNATSGNKQWQVLTDPKNNTQYRYNPVTGQSTTLDGQTPYAPSGAAKISNGNVRSAASAAVQRYLEENPNATSSDVAQFAADFSRTNKSVTAFATGKQGDQVRFLNNSIAHLNTLSGLADALGNGNIQVFNRLGQAISQQTGSPAPTNFEAAKQIVSDEVVKAILNSGGGVSDREQAAGTINKASSPQQLKGVIQTYQTLLGGQLQGLKRQYKNATGRDDFETMLSPDTQHTLEPPVASPAPASASGWSNFKEHN